MFRVTFFLEYDFSYDFEQSFYFLINFFTHQTTKINKFVQKPLQKCFINSR